MACDASSVGEEIYIAKRRPVRRVACRAERLEGPRLGSRCASAGLGRESPSGMRELGRTGCMERAAGRLRNAAEHAKRALQTVSGPLTSITQG